MLSVRFFRRPFLKEERKGFPASFTLYTPTNKPLELKEIKICRYKRKMNKELHKFGALRIQKEDGEHSRNVRKKNEEERDN